MLRKNFKSRKNRRRAKALEQVNERLAVYSSGLSPPDEEIQRWIATAKEEQATLIKRLSEE